MFLTRRIIFALSKIITLSLPDSSCRLPEHFALYQSGVIARIGSRASQFSNISIPQIVLMVELSAAFLIMKESLPQRQRTTLLFPALQNLLIQP